MNGATADPCVNTNKPPNMTIMTMIGRSQNFFRTLTNCQSSAMKAIVSSLLGVAQQAPDWSLSIRIGF
jgi:hypothetical protein